MYIVIINIIIIIMIIITLLILLEINQILCFVNDLFAEVFIFTLYYLLVIKYYVYFKKHILLKKKLFFTIICGQCNMKLIYFHKSCLKKNNGHT